MNGTKENHHLGRLHRGPAVWLLACLPTMLTAQAGNLHALHAQSASEQFSKLSTSEQKRVRAEVEAACNRLPGDHFGAVRTAIDQSSRTDDRRPPKGATRRSPKSTKKADSNKSGKAVRRPQEVGKGGDWEFPATVGYVFGQGVVKPTGRPATAASRTDGRVAIELALLGMLPGTDRALAELERRLDSDRTAAAFAAFLDSWQNGDETFYDALDRTAGTDEGVFFYDAMIGDFVDDVANSDPPAAKALRQSLDAAHAALHQAFLGYRQYRAFREAVALSMLMPPDVPLPKRLSRYEAKCEGAYSLREQVIMVMAVHGHDPMVVAELVRATAEPLPTPLWSRPYDPFVGWNKAFVAAIPRMLETTRHTDDFLQLAIEVRTEAAARIRESAASIVGVPPPATRY